MREREPIFNLPPVIVFLLAILTVIHVARSMVPPEMDGAIVATFGFTPARVAFLFDQKAVLAHLNDLAARGRVASDDGPAGTYRLIRG